MAWTWILLILYAPAIRTEVWLGHGCIGYRMHLELGTGTLLWFGHGCCGYRMLLEHARNYSLGMGALATEWSWNTNVIMVWPWMLRMLQEHERMYGLGMDGLVIALTRTRLLLCCGHACAGHHMQRYWPAWTFKEFQRVKLEQRNELTIPAPRAKLRGRAKKKLRGMSNTRNTSLSKQTNAPVPLICLYGPEPTELVCRVWTCTV